MWFSACLFAKLTQASIALVCGLVLLDQLHQFPPHTPQSWRHYMFTWLRLEPLNIGKRHDSILRFCSSF